MLCSTQIGYDVLYCVAGGEQVL